MRYQLVKSIHVLVELVIKLVNWEFSESLCHVIALPRNHRRLCLGVDSVSIEKHNSESEDVNSSE